ncbi:hypothetical protein EDC14_10641 [Hydrogenispora ethanolica]|jgi:alkyl hydroperoxide reductase subunit AhpF|uniref:Uncharacterized protein n=1 Tax=Hydrogenispora ethanolica TaxID=1082276 RepID=A0A4R1QNI7_HYDET|nr:hypothetical protein [Hydrogenispora ethanolica]TCL54391.1 hypothetical protein EDC14_10641 [Hydrogenispora ethanolica]
MKKCPDCHKAIGYGREFCPHCSGELFPGKRKHFDYSWMAGLNGLLGKSGD